MQVARVSVWMRGQAAHWMKKPFAALIAVLCSMIIVPSGSMVAYATDASVTYEDVPAGAWYYDSVYGIAQTGLMTGYENGLFGPDDGLTRAQVATILWRYYNAGEESILCAADQVATTEVEGVRSGRWYTAAANWAISTGVVSGKDCGSYRDFDPDGVCTRAELCTMLANAAHIMTGADTSGWESDLDRLADGSQVPDWARSAMGWCLHTGTISGMDVEGARYAAPDETATRAQMAAILMNALDAGVLGKLSVDDGAWSQTEQGWSYVLDGQTLTSRWVSGKAIPGSGDTNDARYYLNTEGVVESASLFEATLGGSKSYFHTTETGAIVMGVTHDEATDAVYLADADGRLPDSGWLVTGAYTDGSLQRYWVDDTTHACIPGMFTVDGDLYYTRYDNGAVLRGTATLRNGVTYQADNDGRVVMPFSFQATSGSSASSASTYMSGTSVLFLPSHTELSEVRLEFSRLNLPDTLYVSASVEGGYFAYNSGDALDFNALGITADSQGFYRLYVKQTPDATSYQTLRIMVSRNICSTFIMSVDPDAQGRAYVEASEDHTVSASVCVLVVDADGTVLYNGDSVDDPATIKGRGNGTWTTKEKKPYQIKLSSKASLITGDKANAAKKWNLLASAFDGSMMREYVAHKMALAIGLADTPDCRYTDLYYDGEYRGTYLLTEKVEVNKGRVEITDLDDLNESADSADLEDHSVAAATNGYGYEYHYVTGVVDPPDISGGYLLERDNYYESEKCWFDSSIGPIVVKTPEYASEAEMRYISEYFQTALNASSGDLGAYFDMESLASVFLVQSMARNVDYIWWSSTYFYKDAGDGKIYSGPVWDFDLAFGVENDGHWDPTAWWPADEYYFYWENRTFRALAKEKFNSQLASIMQRFLDLNNYEEGSFISTQEMLTDSARMNSVIWGARPDASILEPSCIYDTWMDNVAYLHSWMLQRYVWLSGQINSSDW